MFCFEAMFTRHFTIMSNRSFLELLTRYLFISLQPRDAGALSKAANLISSLLWRDVIGLSPLVTIYTYVYHYDATATVTAIATATSSSTCHRHYHRHYYEDYLSRTTLVAMFMGQTLGPSGADRTQVGPMLVPWTLYLGLHTIWFRFAFLHSQKLAPNINPSLTLW